MTDEQRDEAIRSLDKRLYKFETWITVLVAFAFALGLSGVYFKSQLAKQLDTIDADTKSIAADQKNIQILEGQIKETSDEARALAQQVQHTKPAIANKIRAEQLSKLADQINVLKARASDEPSSNFYPSYVKDLTSLADQYIDLAGEDLHADADNSVFGSLIRAIGPVARGGGYSKDNDPYFRWHTQDAPFGFTSLLNAFEDSRARLRLNHDLILCYKNNLMYWSDTLDPKTANSSKANSADCRKLGISWEKVLPTAQAGQ